MNPINPNTTKVEQSFFPLSLKPSSPTSFPLAYSDNVWDIVREQTALFSIAGQIGQYTQHDVNEMIGQCVAGIIESLGLGCIYMGVATASTTPETGAKGFYFALTAGTYSHFLYAGGSAITIDQGEIAAIVRSGNAWTKQHIMTRPYIDPVSKHWIVDGQDSGIVAEGVDGKSAYQIWIDAGNQGTEQDFLNSLKATVGALKPVDYDGNAPSAIGGTATAIGGVTASSDTLDVIVLMPNAASDPTATRMYVTNEVASTPPSSGTPGEPSDSIEPVVTYQFVYISDLGIDLRFASGQSLNNVRLVNDLETGGVNNILTAEQGKVLNEKISQLKQVVNYPAEWITGKYLSKNTGLPVNQENWSISNMFPVVVEMSITLNGTVSGSSVAAAVFYDNNGNPLTNVTGGVVENGTYNNYSLIIPDNAAFVRFCKRNNDVITFDLIKSEYQEKFNKEMADSALKMKNAYIPLRWIYDEYINVNSGNFVAQNGYARTGLIDIHGLTPLYLNGTVSGSVVAGVAMFDSNCNYIGASVTAGTYTDEPVSLLDNAYYIALSTSTPASESLKLSVNTAPQALMNGIAQDRLTSVNFKWFTHNYVKKETGEITRYSSVNFQISQNIYVNYRHNYYVTTNGIGNASTASMIAYYAADGSFLGELYGPASTATADQYDMFKLAIPANTAYIIVTRSSENYTNQRVRILTDDNMVNVNSYSDEADSLDLQTKITAGGTVKLANRNYTITTAIEVPSNCEIIGQGNTTMYLDTAAGSTKIFHLDNKENVHITGIKFNGQASITAGSPTSQTNPPVMNVTELRGRTLEGTRTAILIENGDRFNLIENCEFTGFDKAGVVFYRSHDTHWHHCKISNCQFYKNWYGLLLDVRAEFTNTTNCSFNLNKVGVYVAGGNNVFSNNHYDGNEVGFCVCSTFGENADHGSSSNCTYNHNTVYGIACIDAASGFIFTAASCYEGTMIFDNCNAIQVVNSTIAVNIINQYTNDTSVVPTRSGICMITNNLFKNTYMQNPDNPIPNKTKLILKNNYWYTGEDSSDLNN